LVPANAEEKSVAAAAAGVGGGAMWNGDT